MKQSGIIYSTTTSKTVLTTELRKLGDVRVISTADEPYNEKLRVIVSGGLCTTVFITDTQPVGPARKYVGGYEYDGELFVQSWILGGNAKDQWASFVYEFDRRVLEADRKRLFR